MPKHTGGKAGKSFLVERLGYIPDHTTREVNINLREVILYEVVWLSCPRSLGLRNFSRAAGLAPKTHGPFVQLQKKSLHEFAGIRARLYTVLYGIHTGSTAQGGGGSFNDRKPIGELGCCDLWMAE